MIARWIGERPPPRSASWLGCSRWPAAVIGVRAPSRPICSTRWQRPGSTSLRRSRRTRVSTVTERCPTCAVLRGARLWRAAAGPGGRTRMGRPGSAALGHPDVQRLLARIAPDGHRPRRHDGPQCLASAEQPGAARPPAVGDQAAASSKCSAPTSRAACSSPREALAVDGGTVLRCGTHLAEVDAHVEAERLHDAESYRWLFEQLGTLHRALADADMPNAVTATWAPPSSLRRWLARTAGASAPGQRVAGPMPTDSPVGPCHRASLDLPPVFPQQVVHGDVRLSNLRADAGRTHARPLDLGSPRPRVHDLSYALARLMTLARGARRAGPADRGLRVGAGRR